MQKILCGLLIAVLLMSGCAMAEEEQVFNPILGEWRVVADAETGYTSALRGAGRMLFTETECTFSVDGFSETREIRYGDSIFETTWFDDGPMGYVVLGGIALIYAADDEYDFIVLERVYSDPQDLLGSWIVTESTDAQEIGAQYTFTETEIMRTQGEETATAEYTSENGYIMHAETCRSAHFDVVLDTLILCSGEKQSILERE